MATIFVFGFDLGEAAQIRRIRSFRAAGHAVRSATLRRSNMNAGFVPDWPNIDLGLVENERLGRRLAVIASAVGRMARRRRALDGADLIVARNLDMLAIAWAARLLAGRTRTPLVYECLDIHGLLTRPGPVGAAARWAERRLLARTTVTLVSSPGFTREWFGRVQGHRGRVVLLENKLWFDAASPPRPTAPQRRRAGRAADARLGWLAALRAEPAAPARRRRRDRSGAATPAPRQRPSPRAAGLRRRDRRARQRRVPRSLRIPGRPRGGLSRLRPRLGAGPLAARRQLRLAAAEPHLRGELVRLPVDRRFGQRDRSPDRRGRARLRDRGADARSVGRAAARPRSPRRSGRGPPRSSRATTATSA